MQTDTIARWPFRVMAAIVVLVGLAASAFSLYHLVADGELQGLMGIAISLPLCLKFWGIALGRPQSP
jgi:hypothetical protein